VVAGERYRAVLESHPPTHDVPIKEVVAAAEVGVIIARLGK
jgi:hypothetical protein